MLFNSTEFLLFFPLVLIIYYILPQKIRQIWLLGASYFFYMNWNPIYGLLLLLSTFISFAGAIGIAGNFECVKKKKLFFYISVAVNVGLLLFFKYSDFIVLNINRILYHSPLHTGFDWDMKWALPVGISFYILQSTGYVIDVYRKAVPAEKNFLKYALFVSFFPQLVAGPIERSGNLLHQLQEPKPLTWENCKCGTYLILWGYFTKLVIADRVAVFVDVVYGNPDMYQGIFIIMATCLFAIQIYCDFYGYSTIAKGVALCFGIRLMDNFNAPYLSQSVTEFWRRWHISLSGWFRDYMYIPLGGNRKGNIRRQLNRLVVFSISGLWHGASFAFIAWGFLNGLFQTFGDMKTQIKAGLYEKSPFIFQIKEKLPGICLLKRIITFSLICITWIFFRSGDMTDAWNIIYNVFYWNWGVLSDGSIYQLGITKELFGVVTCAILVLFVIDYYKYNKKDVIKMLTSQKWWIQMGIILLLLFSILLFGCYGKEYDSKQFIYFQF